MMALNGVADRDQLKNAKIAVLRLINENREILFGKLSDSLSREAKEGKWAEVAEHAHALGAFPSHRSWDYLKDTTWQNWRKRFVEKREKKEKFEQTGVGAKIVYDDADILIKEILESLGRSGPTVQTSNNSFTSPSNSQFRDISEVLEIEFDDKNEDEHNHEIYQSGDHLMMNENDDEDSAPSNYSSMHLDANGGDFHQNGYHDEEEFVVNGLDGSPVPVKQEVTTSHPKIVSTSSLSTSTSRANILRKSAFASLRSGSANNGPLTRKRPANFLTNLAPSRGIERELTELRCKKIRAELELLEREAYKKDLEILQLERSLGLPASHITRKFYNRANHSVMSNR